MVLEATVLCIDNSEWMRNGDYLPTRFEAQNDAATLIFNGRTNSNPENSVGLISMAGKSPEVLVTLTQDLGTLLTAIAGVKIHGNCNFQAAIQVAQLCLKHRQNKNQRQRIIAFVGSPITVDKKELIRLGKRLKKNNIAVDIISFGEVFENEEKLTAFQNAVNNNDNSHLIPIPYGDAVMSDWLLQSQFLFTGDESDEGSGGGGFNLSNPDNDPNIALAIRLSMEEAQERAARESGGDNKAAGGTAGGPAAAAPAQPSTAPAPAPAPAAVAPMDQEEDDEDEQLALALAMSQEESRSASAAPAPAPAPGDAPAAQPAPAPAAAPVAAPADMDVEEDDEDEEMRLALEMSKQSSAEPSTPTSTKTEPAVKTASDQAREAISDPEFLASVLGGLEGVNPNDARIQDALKGLKKDEKK